MRRNLVVLRCGQRSLHPSWLDAAAARNWDLLLCPFQEILQAPTEGVFISDVTPGQKWNGLAALFRTVEYGPEFLATYDFVWLPDDDILTSQQVINDFFDIMQRFDVNLGSPSLAAGSYSSHHIALHNTAFVARETGFVEVMMPCFGRDALQACLPTLGMTTTGFGWGLDIVWPRILNYARIMMIDATPMLHTRAVNANRSPEMIAEVIADMNALVAHFDARHTYRTTAAHLPDGTRLMYYDYAFIHHMVFGLEHWLRRDPNLLQKILSDSGYSLAPI